VKVGDLIKVNIVSPGVHPVGIITEVVATTGDQPAFMMCLYFDGDYEVLSYDTDFEVLSESR